MTAGLHARARVDGAVVLGMGAFAGALALVAPAPAGLATALVLGVLVRAGPSLGPRLVAVLGAVAFVIGASRASRTVGLFEARRAALLADGAWPARCLVRGTVARSPAQLGEALRVDVDVDDASCDARSALAFAGRARLHVPVALSPALARGDRIEAVAQLAPPDRFWNDSDPRPGAARRAVLLTGGADDVRVVEHGRGLGALVDGARERVRQRIERTYTIGAASMARALVLGEDDLSSEDQRAFRRSGLAHLLAVSGMHLVIVVAGAVAAIRALLLRIPALAARFDVGRIASAAGIPLAWIYADFAGSSGSAVRAAWMATVALLARALARRPDAARSFGLSLVAMLAFEPLAPYDASFALSAAATAGLLALARPLARLLTPLPRLVAVPLATTAAATIACAPLLAGMTGELAIAGLAANVVAVPLGELAALPLCLVHTVLTPFPLAERGAALAGSGALALVARIAHAFASMPLAAVRVPPPTPGQLAALAVLVFAVAGLAPLQRSRRRLVAAALAAAALLEVRARREGAPVGLLRATILDVGQGDAALVDLPDGSALLVDGGGLVGSPVDVGERVLAPVLRVRRRDALAAVVLSHPHPDHYGGLVTGLSGVDVGALWDTGQGEEEGAGGGYATLLRGLRDRGVAVLRPGALCGARVLGGAVVEVLAPCPRPTSDRGPNDNSFVLRIRHGRRALLFVGDAEREEEHDLLATAGASALRADVLKVGHHGSRTSTSRELLDAVGPGVAVISCGVRNRFGHPHGATLDALATARVRTFRTDHDGAVVVTTDGAERVEVLATAF